MTPSGGENQTTSTKSNLVEVGKGKRYDIFELSMLRGWSGTPEVLKLQHIWREFQEIKTINNHRYSIMKSMMLWSSTFGYKLDQGIYFGKSTMDEIVSSREEPGSSL